MRFSLSMPKSRANRSLFDWIEKWGNRLPHPIVLFILLTVVVLVISKFGSLLGWHYQLPGQPVASVEDLLSEFGLRAWLGGALQAFAAFPPLSIIIVAMIGVGIADASGLIGYAVQRAVRHAGTWQLTATIMLLGLLSNVAGAVGYIVLIPLACRAYLAAKRSALAGLAAAFAGVAGGSHASVFLTTYDVVLSGISTSAAQLVDPMVTVSPLANYYFLTASVGMLVLVGTWISIRVVEPRLARYSCTGFPIEVIPDTRHDKAMFSALGAAMLLVLMMVIATLHPSGWLTPSDPTMFARSEVIKGLPIIVSLTFALSGLVFGFMSGSFKGESDVIKGCQKSMERLGLFLVIIFFASQLIFIFQLSQLSGLLAVTLSELLAWLNVKGPMLVVGLITFSAFLNLFMGSPMVLWSLMAPVFVPSLMLAGLSVDLIQVAFRIGDSVTNIITPLFGYLGLILATAQQYEPKAKLGTLMSMMLPYSIAFFVMWSGLLLLWVYVFHLPLGVV